MLNRCWHISLCILLFPVLFSCREEKSLTVCFTGDVLLDRGIRTQIQRKGVHWLLDDVSPVFLSADATVINLECPVTERNTPINKAFIFRADPVWLPQLVESGITHAVLANNHTIDQGRKGLEDTAYHLKESGITPIGYGENYKEACTPVWIRQKGIKIALFSSVLLPLENWVVLEDVPAISQQPVDNLCEQIKRCKEENPDSHIIVNLHWGVEFQQTPVLRQRLDARKLINAGADAIIGHHPHVIQKEEIYNGKPIFYSLGNFVFDQSLPEACQSCIVEFTFTPDSMVWEIHPVEIRQGKPFIN